jgi:hypothetical protein
MDITAVLVLFSGLGAWLSARHRAAVPALVFGGLATLLFCATPLGSELPGATASTAHWISWVGAHLFGKGGFR